LADNNADAAHADSAAEAPQLASDDRYVALVQRRTRFGWILSAVMLAIYLGYILVIAFRRDILAQTLGDGVTTVGIPVGLGVILSGIALTAIYVVRANRVFDVEMDALRREYGV